MRGAYIIEWGCTLIAQLVNQVLLNVAIYLSINTFLPINFY